MPARSHKRRAFTLVEMLVVIGIIVLVASVTIPMMAPFYKHQAMRAGARTTQAMLFQARSTAINERTLAGVYLYVQEPTLASHSVGDLVLALDSDGDGFLDDVVGTPAALPQAIDFSILYYKDPPGEYEPVDVSSTDDDGAVTIIYEPNGLVQKGLPNDLKVRVQDLTGEAATITVQGYMGR